MDEYSQVYKLVVEQDEVVGYVVCVVYMYVGMVDVVVLIGDMVYIYVIDCIWDNIVGKKYYIIGGIGVISNGEVFGKNYELFNMLVYCEICVVIGNVYVNYCLFLFYGEVKYYDVLECILYNGFILGVFLDGGGFFYFNLLESIGQYQCQFWFGCVCCLFNICCFIFFLLGYVYVVKGKDVYVNLFMFNILNLKVEGKVVFLEQVIYYFWNGDVIIGVNKNNVGQFIMKICILGWVCNQVVFCDLYIYLDGKCLSYIVKVNGELVQSELKDGYFCIDCCWKKGDKVVVYFDMEFCIVKVNNKVEVDCGCIVVECGLIVYCVEWLDNDFDVLSVFMNCIF